MPSLFALLDQFYPKLIEWVESKECDVYRLGAGAALAQLPILQKLPKPPEFIEIAKKKKLVGHLKKMLTLVHKGKLTHGSPELRPPFPYVDPIPFYFRSEAEAELSEQQPDYFELRDAWDLIVQEIAALFTIKWSNPYGSFEEELRQYIAHRQHGILDEPNEFSAEIARLNDKSAGSDILVQLKKHFPKIAAGLEFADEGKGNANVSEVTSASRATSKTPGEARWLDKITECVHEDARDKRKASRYRVMIREWAEEMIRNQPECLVPLPEFLKKLNPEWNKEQIDREIDWHVGDMLKERKQNADQVYEVLHDPIAITTHLSTPISKKYATLAAIHDVSGHCDFPLDPWRDDKKRVGDRNQAEIHELYLGITYVHLKRLVPDLTDNDQIGIERVLNEVAADLEGWLGNEAPTPVASTSKASPNMLGKKPILVRSRASAKDPVTAPAWKRLKLKESHTGDSTAALDGKSYRVGDPAFKMLDELQRAKGERIKCNVLEGRISKRPSDVFKNLPQPLKKIVDMPGRKGRGASMR